MITAPDVMSLFGLGGVGGLSDVVRSEPAVKGKVDFPQIGFEKGTTERGFSKVSKSV